MATIAPEGVPPEVVNARRTESIDAPHILRLVNESTNTLFGRVNVVNIIEKAVLAVTLCNNKDEVLGHAAFFDYPNIESVDQAEWQEWLNQYYDCHRSTPLNTLFMHYFVAKPGYAQGCAREIVRTAFNAVPDVHFLYMAVPIGSFPDATLAEIYKPLSLVGDKSPKDAAIFGCHRHQHVPVLHVRQARVEDHDDLTPIFNRQSDMLKMAYGDYFLAELIEAQDDHMQCLVAEVDGTAIGFMSISDDVNLDLLNECFELGPFHGLRKPHIEDVVVPPKSPTPSPSLSKEGERPQSAESGGSGKAQTDMDTSKEQGEINASIKSEDKKEKVSSKQSSGRSSRAGSIASETKVKTKLSEAHMGGSSSSLASHDSDGEGSKYEDGSRKSSIASSMSLTSPRSPVPLVTGDKRFVPTYHGEGNAFSIQLFCVDERYEMRSSDFLGKSFSLFADKEFCVITCPHLVPEFPLLQGFVRVTPRCPSTLSQELYLFHRNGLIKDFLVRKACERDRIGVERLTRNIDLHENLLKDLAQYSKARRDEDGTEIQAFVAEAQSQVVGVAIIRREEDIEYIRSHYNIEDFIYFNHHKRTDHGHLHHYALNPMFSHLSKHFLKEVLRQGHKTCLYYPLYPSYTPKEVVERHSLVCSLKEMVPVQHRRQITYPMDNLGVNAPSERVLAEREPYALMHINRKLTLEPKVTINARIVVVGASDVGIGFLEALAYCPHLHFNNVTLISPHGLLSEMPKDELRDQMLASSHSYSQSEHARIGLQAWINVVYGTMSAIDRKKKYVCVENKTMVPYDHLVLCTGQQYQVPGPTGADINTGVTNSNLPKSAGRRNLGPKPKNLFIVNDPYEAAVALYWIENNLVKSQRKAVVYGATLDAFSCVQTLLTMGLSGDKIAFVHPPDTYEASCFNNADVEESMMQELQACGVQVYTDCLLAQWNDTADPVAEIKSVSFTTSDKPVRLECCAVFAYYSKGVNYQAFRAINDACLVYDGRLVIDAYFHTNDVSIRGAGTLTKFQRKYHAEQWSHGRFNSKEIGIHLATEMLRLFDPTLENQGGPSEEQLTLIPIYRNPKIEEARLPGGYHYLHVKKPGLDKPLVEQMGQSDYGTVLVTGKEGDGEYIRIHLNQYSKVETITCLSKQPVPSSNIVCLFGIHERTLNNLKSRFNEGLVKDLYSFFREKWCLAIYHDRFADFRDELRELLTTRPIDGTESLEELVRAVVDPELPLSEKQKQDLMTAYKTKGAKHAVEARLLNFLSYNYYHLPMYAKPGMV